MMNKDTKAYNISSHKTYTTVYWGWGISGGNKQECFALHWEKNESLLVGYPILFHPSAHHCAKVTITVQVENTCTWLGSVLKIEFDFLSSCILPHDKLRAVFDVHGKGVGLFIFM